MQVLYGLKYKKWRFGRRVFEGRRGRRWSGAGEDWGGLGKFWTGFGRYDRSLGEILRGIVKSAQKMGGVGRGN